MAQQSRDPLMPDSTKLRPWEQRLDRFYNQGNPQRETDKATGRLFGDPLHRLGEPENKPFSPHAPTGPGTAPPTLRPGVAELDRDNSGTITREEYFRGRTPFMTPQDRIGSRGRRTMDRLNSQFRDLDRNRDGIVTPEEVQQGGGSRF
jgi:hypothetical protein